MLEVKPGNLADLLAIDYEAPLFSSDNRFDLAQNPTAAEILLAGYSRILYEDGIPIAAMGLIPKWDAVAYGWGVLSTLARERYPLALSRMARRGLEFTELELGIKRIEIAVLRSHHQALEWAYSLGFAREGKANCYGPGALGTVVLFARVV